MAFLIHLYASNSKRLPLHYCIISHYSLANTSPSFSLPHFTATGHISLSGGLWGRLGFLGLVSIHSLTGNNFIWFEFISFTGWQVTFRNKTIKVKLKNLEQKLIKRKLILLESLNTQILGTKKKFTVWFRWELCWTSATPSVSFLWHFNTLHIYNLYTLK